MTFPDITQKLRADLPDLKGRLAANVPLSDITWFRVGGSAQVLYTPADETDLAYFLTHLSADIHVLVIGLGSNLLVRDGGVPGVVIRLGRGFAQTSVEDGDRLRVGAAVPDMQAARAAAKAGLGGLSFYRGIPGSIGGALRMNAGAHGAETKDALIESRGVDRQGRIKTWSLAEMHMTYRHSGVPADVIFTQALYQGTPASPEALEREMTEVTEYREKHQPIRERTGGSTFRNPPGHSAWKLIDAAGCRGLRIGGAKVSEMHCNFLINDENAAAEDIERLGETVRARVKAHSGVTLQWEIVRLGEPLPGRATGEALAEGT